jgi:hypothetical protein
MTSEPGSFARKTIVERKPQILHEVSQAHAYPAEIQATLVAYGEEIASGPIQPLHEDAPDVDLWNGAWAEVRGRTWLDVPWYFAETFFYRRLMEVVRFYQPGPWRDVDPFAPQKEAQLADALPVFLGILEQDSPPWPIRMGVWPIRMGVRPIRMGGCPGVPQTGPSTGGKKGRAPRTPKADAPQVTFTHVMHDALWGNRADLSNRTISATAGEGLQKERVQRQAAQRLLIDDARRIWRYLLDLQQAHGPAARVDVVADNSGLELLLDLRLADFLLESGLAREVRLHLKHMPFFVSDAMRRDLAYTLEQLSRTDPPGSTFASRLHAAIERSTLTVRDDPFWSTCLSYHSLPAHIEQELAASDLALFKGDVNYRRLLDDRHWPHTARMADIARHMPVPFCALRTLKGELIVDLEPGQAEELAAADPTWMINGQRGVVQFVDSRENNSRV